MASRAWRATAFGTRVTSSVPIVAERAMYWPGGFFDYYEGHVSAGATQTGSHWVLAEGEEAGPNQARTFVLIANTGVDAGVGPRPDAAGDRPGGGQRAAADPRQRPAHVSADHVAVVSCAAGSTWSRRGSSTGALVVEGSIYWNAAGRVFGAGANWPATRIP